MEAGGWGLVEAGRLRAGRQHEYDEAGERRYGGGGGAGTAGGSCRGLFRAGSQHEDDDKGGVYIRAKHGHGVVGEPFYGVPVVAVPRHSLHQTQWYSGACLDVCFSSPDMPLGSLSTITCLLLCCFVPATASLHSSTAASKTAARLEDCSTRSRSWTCTRQEPGRRRGSVLSGPRPAPLPGSCRVHVQGTDLLLQSSVLDTVSLAAVLLCKCYRYASITYIIRLDWLVYKHSKDCITLRGNRITG